MDRVMYWFTFLVTSLTYDVTVSLQCPTSADAWNRASLALQCKLPNFYHCLKDEKDVITEQCLAKVWIEGGMCPVYSSLMSRIDVIECSTTSCPKSTYWSNSVFLYPFCFETKKETPRTTTQSSTTMIIGQLSKTDIRTPFTYDPQNKTEENKTNSNGTTLVKGRGEGKELGNTTIYLVLGGGAAAFVLIFAIVVIVIVRWRKECKSRNCDESFGQKVHLDQDQECKLLDEKVKIVSTDKLNEKVENVSTDKLSHGITEEGTKSAKCACAVYVARGPNLPQRAVPSNAPQILILVQKSHLEEKQIDDHAKKAFGTFVFCSAMSLYQKTKQEEKTSVLLKDFDFKTASAEEILKKLLATVDAVETKVAFVVAMPLDTWKLNRENIARIVDCDGNLTCKTVFC